MVSRIAPPWVFEIEDLRKSYDGEKWANDGISLRIEPGEVFGLLGPNGAGKTTLVKQVVGLLAPTSGTIELGGYDLVADPDHARQLCSYLPQAPVPIESFKVHEAIELAGRIRGGDKAEVRARTEGLIEDLELQEWRDTLGAKLSGGVRRLVGFAMTIVHPAPLVILDEPTNDVDPRRRRLLWERIRRLGDEDVAVILVTHNVLEAEKSVDRLAIIDDGRTVAEGTPSSLKAADRDLLRLQVMLTPGVDDPALPAWLRTEARVGNTLIMLVAENDVPAGLDWAQGLMSDGIAEEYALGATSLEDVYVRLTTAEAVAS